MLDFQVPRISSESVEENRGSFTIEPLDRGFGYTFGNSLRRVLLSSLAGAAVTSVRIEGVAHEFSTIRGVKEDVTDIVLNLKGVVCRIDPDRLDLLARSPGGVQRRAGACRSADRLRQADAGHRDRRLDRSTRRAARGGRDPDLPAGDLHRRRPGGRAARDRCPGGA